MAVSKSETTSIEGEKVYFPSLIRDYFRNWTRNEILKVSMISSLVLVSTCIGLLIYFSLVRLEISIFETEYYSLADDALESTVRALDRASLAALTIAAVYSTRFPNATTWPNVYLPEFQRLSDLNVDITSALTFSFLPIVKPQEVPAFEKFMEVKLAADPRVPLGAGRITGEFGIFFGNFHASPPVVQRDFTGRTFFYNSSYRILTPVSQVGLTAGKRNIMFNARQFPTYGQAIDSMLACSEIGGKYCGRFSDFLPAQDISTPGQQSMITHPIMPSGSPSEMKGLIGAIIDWHLTFKQALPIGISGVMYIVQSPSTTYTFIVEDSMPKLLGEGNLHDTRFSEYARVKTLSLESEIDPTSIVKYVITFYPTNKYYSKYRTDFPLYSSFGAAFIILLTSIIFFVYDKFMTKDNMNIQMVLDAKRQFVRFVSHEVRTPLNTVSMGIKLVSNELHQCLSQLVTISKSQKIDAKTQKYQQLVDLVIPGWLELVQEISENVENAVTVLNDLLNYDKIEVGSLKLEIQVLDICDLINKTVRAFDLQARNAGVDIILNLRNATDANQLKNNRHIHSGESIKFASFSSMEEGILNNMESIRMVGDPTRLAQVIRNLISNALKFTPAGGTIEIRGEWVSLTGNIPAFTYEKDGRTVSCPYDRAGAMRLSVKDSGAGLSTEELARIFGEGVQFNANALQAGQGSGLGLFITKGIIEKHQGTIKVHSDGLGQGTTFTVELPLFSITSQSVAANIVGDAKVFPNNEDCKQADCANLAKNRSSPLEVLTQYPLNDVLVVDDTVSNRKMLIRLLNNRGCSCIEAGHGQEALVRFDERKTSVSADHEPFDAILMDYEMPIMNGPQATKELRERGFEGFIVGITGNVLPSDIQFFKDNGANIVLPKPLEIELLLQEWNIFKNKYCRISSRTEDIIIMNPRFSRNTFLDLHTEDYD